VAALEKWGPNRFEVPIPRFSELLWDQLMAPFFCFQVGQLRSSRQMLEWTG
jgi:cation-transporting ATPase 13A1